MAKNRLKDFKEESKDEAKEQLKKFLMSDEGFIPIEEAIKEPDKK